jgi:molecular chaperone DnaK (HSP70)
VAHDASFAVGIDLGTTNSSVACMDLRGDGSEPAIEVVPIPQLVEAGEVAAQPLLPSFLYIAGDFDFPGDALRLPWDGGRQADSRVSEIVGELARKRGAENPSRLVASAKSWLSHAGASRTSPILPWGAPDEVPKLSPVEVSARYLRHLRHAWDARVADATPGLALARQTVLLTVPASFDEEARELTLRAAEAAGLEQVTLLEEPQAACYAWIAGEGERWRRRLRLGDLILVCDIGGGTTDFSLILVGERDGDLSLERVAIGDHLLLGGDNMDLALGRLLQQRIEAGGQRVDRWQLQTLWHQCRAGKEALFSDPRRKAFPIVALGKGAGLIGGALRSELRRDDLEEVLLDGFFPLVESSEMPARRRQLGLQELGLPYAADAAVTRHLARFLARQAAGGPSASLIRRGSGGLACRRTCSSMVECSRPSLSGRGSSSC